MLRDARPPSPSSLPRHGGGVASAFSIKTQPNSPKRLFVRRGSRWHRLYDNVTEQTWTDKTYNASDYIFNDRTTVVGDKENPEKQAMSEVIKTQADNT